MKLYEAVLTSKARKAASLLLYAKATGKIANNIYHLSTNSALSDAERKQLHSQYLECCCLTKKIRSQAIDLLNIPDRSLYLRLKLKKKKRLRIENRVINATYTAGIIAGAVIIMYLFTQIA